VVFFSWYFISDNFKLFRILNLRDVSINKLVESWNVEFLSTALGLNFEKSFHMSALIKRVIVFYTRVNYI